MPKEKTAMKHKDYYNDEYISDFSRKIHDVMPDFDAGTFVTPCLAGWTIRNCLPDLILL